MAPAPAAAVVVVVPTTDRSRTTQALDACTSGNYNDCVIPCVSNATVCSRPEYRGSMSSYFHADGTRTEAWRMAGFYACCRHPLRLQCAGADGQVVANDVCAERDDGTGTGVKARTCPMVAACRQMCRCVVRRPTQCKATEKDWAKCGPMTGLGCELGTGGLGLGGGAGAPAAAGASSSSGGTSASASTTCVAKPCPMAHPPLHVVVESYKMDPFKDKFVYANTTTTLGADGFHCNATVAIPGGDDGSRAKAATSVHACLLKGIGVYYNRNYLLISVYSPCYQKQMACEFAGHSTGGGALACGVG